MLAYQQRRDYSKHVIQMKKCASEYQVFPKIFFMGAQWLSGRVVDSRPRGRGFEPHRRHCFVALEQDTFILA